MTEQPELPTVLIEESLQILAGPCQSVDLYPHLALRFKSGVLFVHTTWRAHQHQVVAASEGPSKETLPGLVIGAQAKSIDAHGPYHDLVVLFDNGVLFETFADSAEYEHWEVRSMQDRRQLIAGPGKMWSAFAM